ncbi:hypothetical protein [Desulforamulus aquiferis]|uniref:Tail fiber protein n=1 Tax=Desulforamulus aquiferis TaxID=1397668 RepID=A0AAW7ZCT8_9FIRM|nr:hypothetical protein [Desulforamulus aquiferis]MDO7787504.1 hypothetical protein [Desulforamulus aquiferis]
MWVVFAKAAEIVNYLKTNLSSARTAKIDNLDAAVSSRMPGTTTHRDRIDTNISSRADLTTVNTINTNVGSNADASSASGSVHAKAKDIKALLSTVNVNVGSNADAASASGSVHGKLKDIKSAISGLDSPRNDLFSYQGSINNTGGFTTVLNITGSGTLSHACSRTYSTGGFSHRIRITIDSQVVLYVQGSYAGPNVVGLFNPAMLWFSDTYTGIYYVGSIMNSVFDGLFPHSALQYEKLFILHSPLVYKTNLKIEIDYNSSTSHCRYSYGGTINR